MGMHADERRRFFGTFDIAAHQSDVGLAVEGRAIGDHAEVAVPGRNDSFALALNQAFVSHAVADDLSGGDHLELVLAAEIGQFRYARHASVVAHDLADDARGVESGHARKIDRGFGLPSSDKDAAFAGAQRKYVAGTHQVRGTRSGIDGDLDGAGAVSGADAGGDALASFDGFGEGGAEGRLVGVGHGTQAQVITALLGQREADESAAVAGHKVDGLGRNFFRGHGEVAFVLAVLVIDDDDHTSGAHLFQRSGNITEWGMWTHTLWILAFAAELQDCTRRMLLQ